MIRKAILAFAVLLCPAFEPPAFAQTPPDPVGDQLFPPELVMQHQRTIGLSPRQRTSITEAIGRTQGKLLELQWEMQAESEKLVGLLSAPAIVEATALAQVDRVLAVEREVKRRHLSLLIQIKNTLSREQQRKLASLREAAPKGERP